MKTQILLLTLLLCLSRLSFGQSDTRADLNVALFAWLPDMAMAFEQIEQDFEKTHPDINLEIEAIDPYSNSGYGIFNGINDFYHFDLVEIDYYRFSNLHRVNPPSLDPIPTQFSQKNDVVGAAAKVDSANLPYFVPHWICGNHLVYRSSNEELKQATSFQDMLKSLHPKKMPLNVDYYGTATLGEYYADAMLDTYGEEETRKHLRELHTSKEPTLKPEIVEKIHLLFEEINPTFRADLEAYHDFSYLYPEDFYSNSTTVLLGYSERLFYVERVMREKKLLGDYTMKVTLDSSSYDIKPFPFAESSKGTPSWVDGFVIPAGKSHAKEDAIAAFLTYITSPESYSVINKATPNTPARYLLPAYDDAFEALSDDSPLISKFRDNQTNMFLIDEEAMYLGMKEAGRILSSQLTKK